MRFAFRWNQGPALALVLAAVLAPAGCSQQADEAAPRVPTPGVSGPDATIGFDDEGTLALALGETATLSISTSPPANYEISFTLLGDALDATLDRTTLAADAAGHASVQLRAPSASTTFRLRASIKDGPSAETAVAVSDKGFGTLRVQAVYQGKRPVTGWIASAVAGTTCEELAPILPGEAPGAIYDDAGPESPVTIESAPVGPNLAVAIRAGHYVYGCLDEKDLTAGATLDVKVPVADKPMDLSDTSLDLIFSYEPAAPEYPALLEASKMLLVDAFLPPQPAESTSILDAMQALLNANDAAAFASKRSANDWEGATAQQLAKNGQSLRELVGGWAGAGLDEPSLGLLGHLVSIGDAQGHASLELQKIGVLDAASAGVPDTHLLSWTADPDDTVHLGGTIYWLPSRYVGGAALLGAKKSLTMLQPNATLPDALDAVFGCDDLAASLGGFGSCNISCVADLCRDALASRWEKGLSASADSGRIGEISVNASGAGKVNDTAAPVLFEGVWLGEVTDGQTVAQVSGKASGYSSIPQDPPPQ